MASFYDSGVLAWWIGMSAASALNVGLLAWTAVGLRREPASDPAVRRLQERLLVLAMLYVVVCAFRAVVPRADLQRITLIDSWIASVAVGRSCATVAELCFVAQWALVLRALADHVGVP